jgi:hypothetical protein
VAGEEVADEIVEDPSVDDDQATGIVVTYVGDSNSDWCVASRQLDIESDRLDSLDFTDPVAMEAAFTDLIGMYEGAVPLAPPELKDYVSISISELLTLQAVLVAVDYNFVNADLSALDDLGGIVQNANDNIELYNEQVCGTPAGVDSGETVLGADNGGFDPGAGTIRDQAVAEFVNSGFTEQEASCIFDNLDFTDPAVGDDTNAIVAVFDLCAIDLARLAELGG